MAEELSPLHRMLVRVMEPLGLGLDDDDRSLLAFVSLEALEPFLAPEHRHHVTDTQAPEKGESHG